MHTYFIGSSLRGFSELMLRVNKSNVKLLRIPTGGRLTSWLFTTVGEELKLETTVLWQILLVVRTGIEPGKLDSKCGVLTIRPRCLVNWIYRMIDGLLFDRLVDRVID